MDRCKKVLKYKNEIDEKDALWVIVGNGQAERYAYLLNVQILRELIGTKLQIGKAAYLGIFWTIQLMANSLDVSIPFVRQLIEWTGPAHVVNEKSSE